MPELPEVETVRQTLRNLVLGKEISGIIINYDKIIKQSDKSLFVEKIIGKKIIEIGRKGKYLYFQLDDDLFLISHLRMEGKYFIKPKDDEIIKHEHIIFLFKDDTTLRYHDVRKFGTMELKNKDELFTTYPLSDLGPEAYELTSSYLKMAMKDKSQTLKAFLLDQRMIAGIGNIYADEICYLAGLNPKQDIKYLSELDYENISNSAKIVMEKAIKAGGTTIRSYTSSLGVTGLFQLQLNVHTMAGKPCEKCGTIIEKTRVAGRGTYLCTTCQKLKN